MMISFRGPAPVSAGHAAQGSCPGVGVVELKEGGASGALVGVLRSVNTVTDNAGVISPTGGATYDGAERSDIHDTVVIFKEMGTAEDEVAVAEDGDKVAVAETDEDSEVNEEDNNEEQEGENSSAATQISGGLCFVAIFALALSMLNV